MASLKFYKSGIKGILRKFIPFGDWGPPCVAKGAICVMCETIFLSLSISQVKQGGVGTLPTFVPHIYVCVYLFVCWVGRSHRYPKRGQGGGCSNAVGVFPKIHPNLELQSSLYVRHLQWEIFCQINCLKIKQTAGVCFFVACLNPPLLL